MAPIKENRAGVSSRTALADPKYYLAEHVPRGQPLVRLRGIGEWIDSGDRYLELCLLNGTAEALEFADAGDRVVRNDFYAVPFDYIENLRFSDV
jgi:hypothetical protein